MHFLVANCCNIRDKMNVRVFMSQSILSPKAHETSIIMDYLLGNKELMHFLVANCCNFRDKVNVRVFMSRAVARAMQPQVKLLDTEKGHIRLHSDQKECNVAECNPKKSYLQ